MLDKARKATEQAAKAAEAEEAARAAEEAAAKAREAARQAQQAAEEAAAAAEEPEAAEESEEPITEDSDPEPEAKPTRARVVRLTKPIEATDSDDDHAAAGPGYMVIAILAVIVIVLATAATTLFLKDRDQNAVDNARKDATWAASRAAQELSAYDYRTIDADVKTAASLTTGKLHTDYVKQIPAFKAEAVKKQLVGTTTVMKTGVITATSTKVVVLIYANRSSTTKDDKTQRLPEALRLKVTMQKTDGRWLAAKMEVIS